MKVGAPPEMTSILSMENCIITSCPTEIGTDPELDEFMVKISYVKKKVGRNHTRILTHTHTTFVA